MEGITGADIHTAAHGAPCTREMKRPQSLTLHHHCTAQGGKKEVEELEMKK